MPGTGKSRSRTARACSLSRREWSDFATRPAGQARPRGSLAVYGRPGRFPVGGISWFEASAYAEFAGKRLPTIYHWYRAANPEDLFADILRLSNFDSKGPVKVGALAGYGPWGTLDMTGNVKEWCANAADEEGARYILGGAWNEPSYRYVEADARSP
jgi:formylglycine-generating enzyme required for sulfatase activity